MDILIITPTIFSYPIRSYAGIEYLCQELALGLVKRGHNVDMVAPVGSKLEGVNILESVYPDSTKNQEGLQLKYLRELPLHNYDVIHDNTHFCLMYLHEDAEELPLVWTYHNNPIYSIIEKPPVRYSNIVSISKWQQSALRKLNIDSKVVYNGINLEYYNFKKERLNRLLFFSRFYVQKGCHCAIDIARKVKLPIDLAGGLFVPDKSYVEYIKRLVSKMPDSKFYGEVTNDMRRELFATDKCLLLPLLDDEPFGIVVIEALASGCVPIVMNKGAMAELIENNVTGYLCNSIDEMINRVNDVDLIDINKCRERADKFSVDRMVENYLDIYKSIKGGDRW